MRAKTSSGDFLRWSEFFDREILSDFHREDHLAARICHEIYELRSTVVLVLSGGKVRLPDKEPKDFLPQFVKTELEVEDAAEVVRTPEEDEEALRSHIADMKGVTASFLGMPKKKSDTGKPKPKESKPEEPPATPKAEPAKRLPRKRGRNKRT